VIQFLFPKPPKYGINKTKTVGGQAMICKNCGAEVTDGAMFCGNCGSRMDVQEKAPIQPAPQPASQQYETQYSQPNTGYVPQNSYQDRLREPLSTGNFMVMMLVSFIPIVNLIMLLVWAFSSDTNLNKKNWSRAMLIWWLIGFAISIILSIALVAVGASLFDFFEDYFSYGFSY
jgi:uncharacterized membrane protein YvbJ